MLKRKNGNRYVLFLDHRCAVTHSLKHLVRLSRAVTGFKNHPPSSRSMHTLMRKPGDPPRLAPIHNNQGQFSWPRSNDRSLDFPCIYTSGARDVHRELPPGQQQRQRGETEAGRRPPWLAQAQVQGRRGRASCSATMLQHVVLLRIRLADLLREGAQVPSLAFKEPTSYTVVLQISIPVHWRFYSKLIRSIPTSIDVVNRVDPSQRRKARCRPLCLPARPERVKLAHLGVIVHA